MSNELLWSVDCCYPPPPIGQTEFDVVPLTAFTAHRLSYYPFLHVLLPVLHFDFPDVNGFSKKFRCCQFYRCLESADNHHICSWCLVSVLRETSL